MSDTREAIIRAAFQRGRKDIFSGGESKDAWKTLVTDLGAMPTGTKDDREFRGELLSQYTSADECWAAFAAALLEMLREGVAAADQEPE